MKVSPRQWQPLPSTPFTALPSQAGGSANKIPPLHNLRTLWPDILPRACGNERKRLLSHRSSGSCSSHAPP